MPEIGQTISHYRIVEKIGQGGMGEVYLADDTTLDRKVALKFLPEAFTSDPERMVRFEREAKLLASLNHPNIAGIYGLEQANGNRFLVLEYVEGETLQARLSKGALPLEDALALCRQIAEGLEAAHEKGVIHRDLKPANVMITAEEKVKILDFGLAKALSDETQSMDSSQSPTLTEAMTRPGVILGTAAYMSPEQAKGKSVDKRADIWAFGCILYECLTGKRAFEGETVTETLAAVIKEEPDFERVPAKARFLLRRCVEKDPKKRLRDIGEALVWIETPPESEIQDTPPKRFRFSMLWGTTATVLLIIFAILYFNSRKGPDITSFHISVPSAPIDGTFAVSPDGHSIAFEASNSTGGVSLFVCDIGSVTPRQLIGTEGANNPFWSPDSRSIGFFTPGKLKRVEITGGFPRDICEISSEAERGGTWSKDGVIIFNNWPLLFQVSSDGGEAVQLTTLDGSQNEYGHIYPCFLPDGRRYLFTVQFDDTSKNGIYVGTLDSDKKTFLLNGMSMAVIGRPDTFLFQRSRTLLAQKFDPKKLTLIGEAVQVKDNIVTDSLGQWAAFSASNKNVLVYRTTVQNDSQFIWFDQTGDQLDTAGEPGQHFPLFDLSPDGKQIAIVRENPATSSWDIWLFDWARNVSTGLTDHLKVESYPRWSPDGLQVAFTSWRNGNADIFVKSSSGAEPVTTLLDSPVNEYMKAWSRDGKYIAYARDTENSDRDIYILPLFGDNKSFPIVQAPSYQSEADFSFDGKWLAYHSNETGTYQVHVVSFPKPDRKLQISSSGGMQPRWRQDGKELYYLSLDGKLMAVNISYESGIDAKKPRILFDAKIRVYPDRDQYEVTPDGQRFLILKPLAEEKPTPFTVVQNWTSSLDQ